MSHLLIVIGDIAGQLDDSVDATVLVRDTNARKHFRSDERILVEHITQNTVTRLVTVT